MEKLKQIIKDLDEKITVSWCTVILFIIIIIWLAWEEKRVDKLFEIINKM